MESKKSETEIERVKIPKFQSPKSKVKSSIFYTWTFPFPLQNSLLLLKFCISFFTLENLQDVCIGPLFSTLE